jgi:hypothetical protein
MDRERVLGINQITPDNYLEILRTPRSISEKSNLRGIISSQLSRPSSADATILIDEEIFKVPVIILQSYSKYFQNFSSREKVIHLSLSEISADVFHVIYAWMLNPSKLVRRENLILLLTAAQVRN